MGFGFRGSSGIDVADEKLSLAVSDVSTGSSMALQKLVMGVEAVVYSRLFVEGCYIRSDVVPPPFLLNHHTRYYRCLKNSMLIRSGFLRGHKYT